MGAGQAVPLLIDKPTAQRLSGLNWSEKIFYENARQDGMLDKNTFLALARKLPESRRGVLSKFNKGTGPSQNPTSSAACNLATTGVADTALGPQSFGTGITASLLLERLIFHASNNMPPPLFVRSILTVHSDVDHGLKALCPDLLSSVTVGVCTPGSNDSDSSDGADVKLPLVEWLKRWRSYKTR
jgi:hypothetical protein